MKVTGRRRWAGAEALRDAIVPIDSVRLDPRNARRHPDKNIQTIAVSLNKYGQLKPIVVHNGIVVAGNGTLVAARTLAWTHIAIVRADHLSPDEATAFGLMDNRSAEMAEWDYAAISEIMATLPADLAGLTGFDESSFSTAASDLDPAQKLGAFQYRVVIECESEQHQRELLDRFEIEGLNCKALVS